MSEIHKGSSLILMLIMILIINFNIQGQCKNVIFKDEIFDSVSVEYQDKLKTRLTQFLKVKTDENFEELYEMLLPTFRKLNEKDDFVKSVRPYYAGENKFASFKIKRIDEYFSTDDGKPSIWYIQGCWTEIIDNKKVSIKTVLDAQLDNNEIFFTDITTKPNPLGENEKCNP